MDKVDQSRSNPWTIGQCVALATLLEATAPKPGNVHRGADFEDVTYPEFVAAGIAIAPVLDIAAGRRWGPRFWPRSKPRGASRPATRISARSCCWLRWRPSRVRNRSPPASRGTQPTFGRRRTRLLRCHPSGRSRWFGTCRPVGCRIRGPQRPAFGHAIGRRPRPGGPAICRGFSPGF